MSVLKYKFHFKKFVLQAIHVQTTTNMVSFCIWQQPFTPQPSPRSSSLCEAEPLSGSDKEGRGECAVCPFPYKSLYEEINESVHRAEGTSTQMWEMAFQPFVGSFIPAAALHVTHQSTASGPQRPEWIWGECQILEQEAETPHSTSTTLPATDPCQNLLSHSLLARVCLNQRLDILQ